MIGTPTDVAAIVDWDDAIIGDPVDDLAILKCFYNDDIFQPLLEGYRDQAPLPDLFLSQALALSGSQHAVEGRGANLHGIFRNGWQFLYPQSGQSSVVAAIHL